MRQIAVPPTDCRLRFEWLALVLGTLAPDLIRESICRFMCSVGPSGQMLPQTRDLPTEALPDWLTAWSVQSAQSYVLCLAAVKPLRSGRKTPHGR